MPRLVVALPAQPVLADTCRNFGSERPAIHAAPARRYDAKARTMQGVADAGGQPPQAGVDAAFLALVWGISSMNDRYA